MQQSVPVAPKSPSWASAGPNACPQDGTRRVGFGSAGTPNGHRRRFEGSNSLVKLLGMTEARTRMPSRAADFRTTSAFAARPYARPVRGLDCALTIEIRRSEPRQAAPVQSLHLPPAVPDGLARRCQRTRARESAEFERIPAGVSTRPAHDLSLLCLPIPPSSRCGLSGLFDGRGERFP